MFVILIITVLILSTYFVNALQQISTTSINNSTVIESKDLLQADATIIAGLLILLTVSSLRGLEFRFSLACFLGIIPFMVSAILLIYASMFVSFHPLEITMITNYAKGIAVGGFIFVPLVVFVLSRDILAFYKRLHGDRDFRPAGDG
jgi:hypothetical protein